KFALVFKFKTLCCEIIHSPEIMLLRKRIAVKLIDLITQISTQFHAIIGIITDARQSKKHIVLRFAVIVIIQIVIITQANSCISLIFNSVISSFIIVNDDFLSVLNFKHIVILSANQSNFDVLIALTIYFKNVIVVQPVHP